MALLSTTLSEDSFTGYFLSGFIELPGGLLAVLLLLKFGRRLVTVWSFSMQCILLSLAINFSGITLCFSLLMIFVLLFNFFLYLFLYR